MRLPARLLQRKLDSHKGDYGHVFIFAGSLRFSGAAVLSATAALRSGAGLVTLGLPKGIAASIIKIKPNEVMLLPLDETKEGSISYKAYKKINEFIKKVDILVIGPGLGPEAETARLVRKLLLNADKPLVLDADGINALAGKINLFDKRKVSTIITPHLKEMARLLEISIDSIRKNRLKLAKNFAKAHKLTLVLKGHKTLVVDSKGKSFVNNTGNPGMATAGSGDVLTGMIAAFLGQKLNVFEAVKFAVYLHGLAGDLAAKEKTQISLIATDIIDKIPAALKRCSCSKILPA